MSDFSDLKFIRIDRLDLFGLIPRKLFEQIPDREWEVNKLYEWMPIFLDNPLNLFWALANKEAVEKGEAPIKGVLWATVDPVLEMVAVNVLSIDKEYQSNNGSAIKGTIKFLKDFRDKIEKEKGVKLQNKILWATTRPKAFERAGCSRHNKIIMEAVL